MSCIDSLYIIELANREIIQKPSYIKDAWEEVFQEHGHDFASNLEQLDMLYNSAAPTARKILQLLKVEPRTEPERETYDFMLRFIRTLHAEDVGKFMQFGTGADIMCVNKL